MSKYVEKTLLENWRREMQAARLYRQAADQEVDLRRKSILLRLAEVELKHAKLWEAKLTDLGVDISREKVPELALSNTDLPTLLEQIEKIEQSNETWYQSQKQVLDDPDILKIIDFIDEDEKEHQSLDTLTAPTTNSPSKRLTRIWGEERWHKNKSGGWVGDAIYGVNDGLGAIFGIIAGVAGYVNNNSMILVSGLFGALASTLSMGAGAWLATKSENELMESEIYAERREIEEDPEHEIEELALLYELKGFEQTEATRIANQIAGNKELFLKTMAQEELGIHETSQGNPWSSALFGSVSTLIGAIVPLLPFLFLKGSLALILAAVISILAHFMVGALKSLVTVRSWWVSGLEMTLVGVLVGGVSYGLGELGRLLIGSVFAG